VDALVDSAETGVKAAEPHVRFERELYGGVHGVHVLQVRDGNELTYEKRVALSPHVQAITARSYSRAIAESWVMHVRRLEAAFGPEAGSDREPGDPGAGP
jgi:hypothetical protein